MAVNIKQISFLAGMDTDTPDFSTDPRFVREMINMEPNQSASGCHTVEGYQRFAGGELATEQQFCTILFNNGSYELKEGNRIYGSNDKEAVCLKNSDIVDGDYNDNTAIGYVAIYNEGINDFEVGDEIIFNGNIIGVISDITVNNYPQGTIEDVVNIFRKLWKYYADTHIPPVPGSGPIVGVFILKNTVYALRNSSDGQFLQLYVALPDNSWRRIEYFNLEPGGNLKFVIANFGDGEKLYGLTGNTRPFIFDGKELIVIDAKVPFDARPSELTVFNNQLFLYYDDIERSGSLLFSAVGKPTDFETTSLGAGELKIPFKVTNLSTIIEDNLAIFGDNIYLLYKDNNGNFGLKEFSENSNVITNSVQKMTSVIFANKSSIYRMSPTNKYGNFELNSLSRRNNSFIDKLISNSKSDVRFSYIVPNKNQYRLVVDNNILVLTFVDENIVLFSRQITKHTFNCISNLISDYTDIKLYYGGNDGYVYKVDSGYTFDNEDIDSLIVTSIISVSNNPQTKCRLRKLILPGELGSSTTLIGLNYNKIDWRRYSNELFYEIKKSSLNTGYYDLSFFDTFYWASSNLESEDNIIELYLNGTTPTIVLTIFNKCKGVLPTKLNVSYLHFSPRSRLR